MKNSKLWNISISNLFTPEEFQAQNPSPLQNSKLTHFTHEEFQAQNTLPWRIPGILDRGGTDIKWNNPMAHVCIALFHLAADPSGFPQAPQRYKCTIKFRNEEI
jgi:hypothetical protein